jgi:hypothetical protein
MPYCLLDLVAIAEGSFYSALKIRLSCSAMVDIFKPSTHQKIDKKKGHVGPFQNRARSQCDMRDEPDQLDWKGIA